MSGIRRGGEYDESTSHHSLLRGKLLNYSLIQLLQNLMRIAIPMDQDGVPLGE